MSQGVFHVELKYTTRGPRLIEVNCRMGGGPVRLTNLLVWGVDLVEEHLLTTAGIPSRPPVRPEFTGFGEPRSSFLRSKRPVSTGTAVCLFVSRDLTFCRTSCKEVRSW